MISAYLEILTPFDDKTLERATIDIRRSAEKYAPSAGQIFCACVEAERKAAFHKLGYWGSNQEADFKAAIQKRLEREGLPNIAVLPNANR